MAWPHVGQEGPGKGVLTSDADGHMDWALPFDFPHEQCADSVANSQETRSGELQSFDPSNFGASSEPYSFDTYPALTQIPISQQQTVNPALLSQQNWPSSGTDSTFSSFGGHSSGFEDNSSTSAAGTLSTNSSLYSQNQEDNSSNASKPNKRRYCERSIEDPVSATSQVHLIYPEDTLGMEVDHIAISIFESWLTTCPSIYPGELDFHSLAALTKLEVGIVKSWFVKKLRARRMEDSIFETWLCSYPTLYPGDEEFKNLADLTRLSPDTVRLWFAQKLRCKTTTKHLPNEPSATSTGYTGIGAIPSCHATRPSMDTSNQPSILQRAASWVKEERGPKCISSLDRSVLLRDDNKPFQCTRKCGKKFRDRDDWRKHEEVNWPQEGWVCDLPAIVLVSGIQICTHCGMPNPEMDHFQTHKKTICSNKAFTTRGRLHHRKQHFLQHFDNVHPHIPCDDFVRNSHFSVESNFPRWCGFCNHRFSHWKDRVEHIGAHFHDEGRDMTEWNDNLETDHDNGDQGDDKRNDDDENPDNASDSSDDDSDDSPPRSAPKRRTHSKTSRSKGQPGMTATDSRRHVSESGLPMFEKSFEGQSSIPPSNQSSLKERHLNRFYPSSDTVAGHLRYDMTKFLDTLETPPYSRMRLLGWGPFSVVDEVRNLATGTIFARKTITYPRQRGYMPSFSEIEIMKEIDHPHIVQFVDSYTLDKSVSILMSPVADLDLGYFLSNHEALEPMPIESIIQWFNCLVSGLKYLHEKSIKHQDIKPSNILIKGQAIFLADFGIAKTVTDSESTGSTSGDMIMKYCSPETAQCGVRGRKADIFSLGCVFLEMFSLLIPDGSPKFKHFQESHSIGGGNYNENLPMTELWLGVLGQEQIFDEKPILRQLLDVCQAMLEQNSKNRPSAAELSATLPPGKCCLPAEILSKSHSVKEVKEETQALPLKPAIISPSLLAKSRLRGLLPSSPSKPTIDTMGARFDRLVHIWLENTDCSNATDDMESLPIQDSKEPAHSDDLNPTVTERDSQRESEPDEVSEPVRPQISDRSRNLQVPDNMMFNKLLRSRLQFVLVSILMTLIIGISLVPSYNILSQREKLRPEPHILSVSPGVEAAGVVIGSYFSNGVSGVFQTKLLYNSGGGKICIRSMSGTDWLDVQCIEGANPRADTPLTVLDWLGGPSIYFITADNFLSGIDYIPSNEIWRFSTLRDQKIPTHPKSQLSSLTWFNGTSSWLYYQDANAYLREFGLDDYRDITWRHGPLGTCIFCGEYQDDVPPPGFFNPGFLRQPSPARDNIRKHNQLIVFNAVGSDVSDLLRMKDLISLQLDLVAESLPEGENPVFISIPRSHGNDNPVAVTSNEIILGTPRQCDGLALVKYWKDILKWPLIIFADSISFLFKPQDTVCSAQNQMVAGDIGTAVPRTTSISWTTPSPQTVALPIGCISPWTARSIDPIHRYFIAIWIPAAITLLLRLMIPKFYRIVLGLRNHIAPTSRYLPKWSTLRNYDQVGTEVRSMESLLFHAKGPQEYFSRAISWILPSLNMVFAGICVTYDTVLWLSVCFAFALPLLLSGCFEAYLDHLVSREIAMSTIVANSSTASPVPSWATVLHFSKPMYLSNATISFRSLQRSMYSVIQSGINITTEDQHSNQLSLFEGSGDIVWTLVLTALVLFLVPAIICFYSGAINRRRAYLVPYCLAYIVTVLVGFQWFLFGWSRVGFNKSSSIIIDNLSLLAKRAIIDDY